MKPECSLPHSQVPATYPYHRRNWTRQNYLESNIGTSCLHMKATVRCSWLKTGAFFGWSKNKLSYNRIISSTNLNAQFNNNLYVTLLSSTCFGPWLAHPQEEQLHKHTIWYPRSPKRLYTTPVESGVVYSRLGERGYQMLYLCSCSSWGWARQGPKHVEYSNVTYMSLLNCALKLVEEIILYYDARSKKHQIKWQLCAFVGWNCGKCMWT